MEEKRKGAELRSELSCCIPSGDFAASFRVVFSSHCLNLEWDQIRHTGPTNAAWHYWCGTAESWCSLVFLIKSLATQLVLE